MIIRYYNGTAYYLAPYSRKVWGRFQGFVGQHNQTNRWYAGNFPAV